MEQRRLATELLENPAADDLKAIEHYQKVLPGSFDRMISMAERLQAAQIAEAKQAHNYAQADARRGQWLGFTATALAIAAALVALAFGNPWVSAAFVSVPVMGVAKALIDSTKRPSPSQILAAATDQAARIAPAETAPSPVPTTQS
jgi:uncharacterized membrane protein